MKIIKSRIFKALVFLFVVGLVLGIISYFFIDTSVISDNIKNYFNLIENGNFNYFVSLLNSIISNNKYLLFIWISGIILISFFFVPLFILYKGICIGLLLISLIVNLKIKGLLIFIALLVPCILINIIIYILCGYYSLNFSNRLYNCIKKEKLINIKSFSKNYFYIYVIFTVVLIISSIFEIYISSNIIKFVV